MADEPVCAGCKATSSLMWEKNKEGEVLCLECHSNTRQDSANTSSSNPEQPVAPGNETTAAGAQTETQHAVRRTRLRNAKGRYGKTLEKTTKAANSHTSAASSALGGNSTAAHHRKGGVAPGRRSLLKGKPNKTPTFAATVVTSDTILHKGTKYEVGDIVSMLDEGGQLYYALIRGFLEDQYAEKYAVLTWLVPTTPNPRSFDPSLFVLGPEEDKPRDMELLDFVTHSPQSNSFLSAFTQDPELAWLWTTKRRRIVFNSKVS